MVGYVKCKMELRGPDDPKGVAEFNAEVVDGWARCERVEFGPCEDRRIVTHLAVTIPTFGVVAATMPLETTYFRILDPGDTLVIFNWGFPVK